MGSDYPLHHTKSPNQSPCMMVGDMAGGAWSPKQMSLVVMLGKGRVAFLGTPRNLRPKGKAKCHVASTHRPPLHHLGFGGCFGCCAKPTPITAVDEPSKRLRIQGRSIRKAILSEDFGSSSAHEMENSAIQSQRSMSSISTAAQSNDQHAPGSSSNPNEFVNQGLMLWNQTRQQWIGNKKRHSRSQQPRQLKLSWNATYVSLLGSNKPFSQLIPLGEMVDLLVDAWEQEGLYD